MKSLEQSDIDFLDELSKLHYCQLYMPPHNKKNTPFFLLKDVKNYSLDENNFFTQLQMAGFSFLCNKEGHIEIIGIM